MSPTPGSSDTSAAVDAEPVGLLAGAFVDLFLPWLDGVLATVYVSSLPHGQRLLARQGSLLRAPGGATVPRSGKNARGMLLDLPKLIRSVGSLYPGVIAQATAVSSGGAAAITAPVLPAAGVVLSAPGPAVSSVFTAGSKSSSAGDVTTAASTVPVAVAVTQLTAHSAPTADAGDQLQEDDAVPTSEPVSQA